MAKYINIGAINIGGIGLVWPGTILSDQYDDIARYQAAGAALWPYTDSTVLAAANVVNAARANGGIDINAAQVAMQNAVLVSGNVTVAAAETAASDSAAAAAVSAAAATDALLAAGLAIYGDGSDGAVDFDGTTTVLGLVPSSLVYTLTRDIYLDDGSTVAALAFINTGCFRVHCKGTLTIAATGGIICNGNDGAAGTAGTGGAGGASKATAGTLGTGTAGGAGGSGNASGSAGTANAFGFPGAAAVGGAGGGDGTHTGAIAGAFTALVAAKGGARALVSLLTGMIFGTQTNGTASLVSLFGGGSGGGGGCGDHADAGGGGGGGGGGVLFLAAYALVNGGTISANGGYGGLSVSAAHNAGGGGGGGGGVAIVLHRSALAVSGITATGGPGGAKAGASGVAGVAGTVGTVIQLAA